MSNFRAKFSEGVSGDYWEIAGPRDITCPNLIEWLWKHHRARIRNILPVKVVEKKKRW